MEVSKFLEFLESSGFPVPDELEQDRMKRILIIDDDPDVTEMLIEVINGLSERYELRSASNGYDGLIEVGDFKPDLVILDLMMPKMDGAEMFKRLRSNPETKAIQVVIITGLDADADLVRRIKRAGVDGFLNKPINLDEFSKLVEKLTLQKV